MADDITTEWESETTRLVRYMGHARGVNFPLNYRRSAGYREDRGRKISRVICHQSAGNRRSGQDAVDRIASWIVRAPKYAEKNGKRRRVGGGRGFPGLPYTFVVPSIPDIVDGKSVVYRCWDDGWRTWHSKGANGHGVGVCFSGSFRTRHQKKFSDDDPVNQQFAAGKDLILNYLLPRYDLTTEELCGHFDYGKRTCPGDAIEAWIRRERGERVDWFTDPNDPEPQLDPRPLRTRAQQDEALVELGYCEFDLSDPEDRFEALMAFQEDEGITSDGWWGPQSEHAMRIALAA